MKPTTEHIKEWLSQIAHHDDRRAFRRLFDAFYQELLRFALFFLKVREVAEEVVLDVFVKVWERRHLLMGIENPRSYLFKATKNHALNQIARTPPLTDWDQVAEGYLLDAQSPETHLLLAETDYEVEQAIALLPPQCQLIFKMVREQGFSYKEVAEHLGVSPRTVEAQMGIALKKLSLTLRLQVPTRK